MFSSNTKTRTWCLGLDPYKEGVEAYIKEFKTLKPCVHGSDAHSLERIGVPCAKRGQAGHDCQTAPRECDLRYCWVKADPTFEGLKQVLYEPAERVIVQGTDPTPIKSNHCIERIEIGAAKINEELSMSGTVLPVNSGLVAVTGGKGSGKTALVDLLANCYMDRRNSGDPNSFVRRIMLDNPDVAVSLRFKDGSVFGKSVKDTKVFDAGELVYIAQGELEQYIGDSSDLETYIRTHQRE